MKRTTIMVDELLWYELKQLAQQTDQSTSAIIRAALTEYVARQHRQSPPANPLLGLIGLGASSEPTDVADGGDEEMLQAGLDAIKGWSVDP